MQGTALRRVKAGEVKRESWVQQDALDYCLDCWKEWISGDGDRDLKAKTMGGMTGNADGYGVDVWEAQQARDNAVGAATNAMIDSLSRYHAWAIYKLCSVATPWNYPNADLTVVGPAAREALRAKLRINVCTRTLF